MNKKKSFRMESPMPLSGTKLGFTISLSSGMERIDFLNFSFANPERVIYQSTFVLQVPMIVWMATMKATAAV